MRVFTFKFIFKIFLVIILTFFIGKHFFLTKNSDVDHYAALLYYMKPELVFEKMTSETHLKSFYESHRIEHAFGDALYVKYGLTKLNLCVNEGGYGCVHQMIGRYMVEHGIGDVPQMFSACAENATKESFAHCTHGIGHGLVAMLGYDQNKLQDVLSLCEFENTTPFVSDCIDGVFMEYHLRSLSEKIPLELSEKTIFSPCDVMGEKFTYACTHALPRWWRSTEASGVQVNDALFVKLGDRCFDLGNRFGVKYLESCFSGIGRVLRNDAHGDVGSVLHYCDVASKDSMNTVPCRWFVLKAVTSFSSESETAKFICKDLGKKEEGVCFDFLDEKKVK